jgi:hypothetical protein
MDAKLAQHLLPHVTVASVAEELFCVADWSIASSSIRMAVPITALPDGKVRSGPWVMAATEAANTHDAVRLARLSRYSQRNVRRAVAGNLHIDDATFAYLAKWAVAKEDTETLESLVLKQDPTRVLTLEEQLAHRVRDARVFQPQAWVTALLTSGETEVLVDLLTGTHPSPLAELVTTKQVAQQYTSALFQRRFSDTPTIHPGLDEIFTAAFGHYDELDPGTIETVWQSSVIDIGMARIMVANAVPSFERTAYRSVRYLRGRATPEAAELLMSDLPESFAAWRLVLNGQRDLASTTYAKMIDTLHRRDLDADDHSSLLSLLTEADSHLQALPIELAERLSQLAVTSDAVGLANQIIRYVAQRLEHDTAVKVMAVADGKTRYEWLVSNPMGTTRSGHKMYSLDSSPELIAAAANHKDNWLSSFMRYRATTPELQRAAISAFGIRSFGGASCGEVAAAIAGWFHEEFGEDTTRWMTALNLAEGWEGSVEDLFETTHMLCGGRPETSTATSESDDADVEEPKLF